MGSLSGRGVFETKDIVFFVFCRGFGPSIPLLLFLFSETDPVYCLQVQPSPFSFAVPILLSRRRPTSCSFSAIRNLDPGWYIQLPTNDTHRILGTAMAVLPPPFNLFHPAVPIPVAVLAISSAEPSSPASGLAPAVSNSRDVAVRLVLFPELYVCCIEETYGLHPLLAILPPSI